jgi:hypothetical protein
MTEYKWIAVSTGVWENPANWDIVSSPGTNTTYPNAPNDMVVLPSSANILLNSNVILGSIVVSNDNSGTTIANISGIGTLQFINSMNAMSIITGGITILNVSTKVYIDTLGGFTFTGSGILSGGVETPNGGILIIGGVFSITGTNSLTSASIEILVGSFLTIGNGGGLVTLNSDNSTNLLINGTLIFNQGSNANESNIITGNGMLVHAGMYALTLNSAQGFSGTIKHLGSGNLILNSSGVLLATAIVNNSSSNTPITITNSNPYSASTITCSISGSSSNMLTVPPSNHLIMSASNTFSGIVHVESAVLELTTTYTYNFPITFGASLGGSLLMMNGNMLYDITINAGASVSGYGSVMDMQIMNGGTLLINPNGPSNTSLSVGGNLVLDAGSICSWDLNASSTVQPGDSCNISVTGNITLSPSALLRINIGNALFNNTFWTGIHTWNIFVALFPGTISSYFTDSNIKVYVGGNYDPFTPAGNSQGRFFSSLTSASQILLITWVPSSSIGGDPHVTTITGECYVTENNEQTLVMYDNGEMCIETQMRKMPSNYWNESVTQTVRDSTYMHRTRITIGSSSLVLNNHTLCITSKINTGMRYNLSCYNPDVYVCYGKTIVRGEFKAKQLCIETKKLGKVNILLVQLNDSTIINDMRFIISPVILSTSAHGALVSSKDVEWNTTKF